MSVVMIGVDPHKASVSIEARETGTERLLGTGRFGTDTHGYRELRAAARQWPERVWAVEGTAGTGRPVAQRLVADGEMVLDVPAKRAARSRVFDTEGGVRRSDCTRFAGSRGAGSSGVAYRRLRIGARFHLM